MKNKEIVDFLWKSFNTKKTKTLHNMSGVIVESLIDKCFENKSSDNLTAVLICLENLKQSFSERNKLSTMNIEDDPQLNTMNMSITKNISLTNQVTKHKMYGTNSSSKTNRGNVDKKLLLNKIIKNTLSIKNKQNPKSENYISLNSKC